MIQEGVHIKKTLLKKNEFFFHFFYFMRYLPLIIICNDWFLYDSFGFYFIFSKFSILNILKSIQIQRSPINAIVALLALIQLTLLFYLYYFNKRTKDSNIRTRLTKNNLPVICKDMIWIFYFLNYYFSNVNIELSLFNILDNKCEEDNIIFSKTKTIHTKSIIKNCTNFTYSSLIIGLIYLIVTFVFNYLFTVFTYSPFKMKSSDFAGELGSVNFVFLLLPILNVYIFVEKLFFLSYHFLIIKLSLRILILIFLLLKLKSVFKKIINKFVLFIEMFCIFSILLEFISFYEFYGILNNQSSPKNIDPIFQAFQKNPTTLSNFYDSKFLIIKFLFITFSSYYVVDLIYEKDISTISDFYSIRKSFLYSVRNIFEFKKFIYVINNYEEEFENKNKFHFLCFFHEKLNKHILNCHETDCDCNENLVKFRKINLILDQEKKIKEMKDFLINITYKVLKRQKHKSNSNYSNDLYSQVEFLFFNIIYNVFIRKKFLSAFFDLEKIKKFRFIKDNKIALIRLEMLKFQIVEEYKAQTENKYSEIENVKNLNTNFEEFISYSDLIMQQKTTFDLFKEINKSISKNERNRKLKNREYFNNKKFYNFENIINDFENLINLFNENSFYALKISKYQKEMDKVLSNDLSIYDKFFNGAEINQTYIDDNNPNKINLFKNKIDEIHLQNYENNIFHKERLLKDNLFKDCERKIVLKLNDDGKIIYEKISFYLASELGYKISEIIGKNMDFLLPTAFNEIHQSHVISYLQKNRTNINNLQVYFVSKSGYSCNYNIYGTVLLTIDHEILIYCEVEKLPITNDYCFISFDPQGEIIGYDKNIEDNLFIDSNFIKYVKPNFYKNFIDMQEILDKKKKLENIHSKITKNNELKMTNSNREKSDNNETNRKSLNTFINKMKDNISEDYLSTVDYLEIINKLRKSDFNKLVELKYSNDFLSQTLDLREMNYSEKLDNLAYLLGENVEEQSKEQSISMFYSINKTRLKNRKVTFFLTKRSISDSILFYDLLLDFSNVEYLNKLKKIVEYKDKAFPNVFNNFQDSKEIDNFIKNNIIRQKDTKKLKLKKRKINESNSPDNNQEKDIKTDNDVMIHFSEKNNHLNILSLKNINFVNPHKDNANKIAINEKSNYRDEENLKLLNNQKYFDKENALEKSKNNQNDQIYLNEIEERKQILKNLQIEKYRELKNERKFVFEVLSLIRDLTIYFNDDKENLELNLSTIQIFVDNYFYNESEILKTQVRKSFFIFKKNNDISSEIDTSENSLSIHINKRIIIIIFLMILFLGIFITLQVINGNSYSNINLFSDFSQYSITLKSYYSLVANSLLTTYLVKNNLEQPSYNLYLNENITNVYYDNSIKYQLSRVKIRSAFFMEKFYSFRNIYSRYRSILFSDNNVLNENLKLKMLSANWQKYNDPMTFYQNLNLFHLYSNSVLESDIENMKLDIFSKSYSTLTTSPNKADIFIHLYMMNTVDPIITGFQRLIITNYQNIGALMLYYQMQNFYLNLFSCILCVILLTVEMILLLSNYNVIFVKLNIITNYLKIFNEIILEKIDVINEIMDDCVLEEWENEALALDELLYEKQTYQDNENINNSFKQVEIIKNKPSIGRIKYNSDKEEKDKIRIEEKIIPEIKIDVDCNKVSMIDKTNYDKTTINDLNTKDNLSFMEELKFAIKDDKNKNLKGSNITNSNLHEKILFEQEYKENLSFSNQFLSKENSVMVDNNTYNNNPNVKLSDKFLNKQDNNEKIHNNQNSKNKLLKATTIENSEDLNLDSPDFRADSILSLDASNLNEEDLEKFNNLNKDSNKLKTYEKNGINKVLEKRQLSKKLEEKNVEIIKKLTLNKKKIVGKPLFLRRGANVIENDYNSGLILQSYLTNLCLIGLKKIGNFNKSGIYKNLNLKIDKNIISKNNPDRENNIYKTLRGIIIDKNKQIKDAKQSTITEEICESKINLKSNQTTVNSALSNIRHTRVNSNINYFDMIANKKAFNQIENLSDNQNSKNSKVNNLDLPIKKKHSIKDENIIKTVAIDNIGETADNLKESTRNSKNHNSNLTNLKDIDPDSENPESFISIEYKKPKSFTIYRNFIIILILILIGISITINSLIYNSYTSIYDFYLIKIAFVLRNSALFDSLFFLKITVTSMDFLNVDLYKNGTHINMFEHSIGILDKSSKIINQYINEKRLDNFNLETIKFFEESFSTKNLCEYYAYFKNETNFDHINENIEDIPKISINDLEKLKKTNPNYLREYNECYQKSGNLFSSGLYEFFNAGKYILRNKITDYQNYVNNNINFEKQDYEKLVRSYFSSDNIVKINYCLRNVVYRINEMYIKLLDSSEKVFRDRINNLHLITNYSLIFVFLIICCLFLKILIILIYKPNKIVDESEKIIKNSIFFRFI